MSELKRNLLKLRLKKQNEESGEDQDNSQEEMGEINQHGQIVKDQGVYTSSDPGFNKMAEEIAAKKASASQQAIEDYNKAGSGTSDIATPVNSPYQGELRKKYKMMQMNKKYGAQ